MDKQEIVAPGLESFWETCDQDAISDHPLLRELCFRLDTIQHYRSLIADAEAGGNDNALEVLSQYFDQQHKVVRRIRDELGRIRAEQP